MLDGCCVECSHDCSTGKYTCASNPCPTCPKLEKCYVGKYGEKASVGGQK